MHEFHSVQVAQKNISYEKKFSLRYYLIWGNPTGSNTRSRSEAQTQRDVWFSGAVLQSRRWDFGFRVFWVS